MQSGPKLVARSGTSSWEEYPKHRQIHGGAPGQPLAKIWESDICPKVISILNSLEIKWHTLKALRIGEEEEYDPPLVLWIGVKSDTLTGADSVVVVSKC